MQNISEGIVLIVWLDPFFFSSIRGNLIPQKFSFIYVSFRWRLGVLAGCHCMLI